MKTKARRHQQGSLWLKGNSICIRLYHGGKQHTKLLCLKDDMHHSTTCRPVRELQAEFMGRMQNAPSWPGVEDCSTFWSSTFLPHVEKTLRPSSIRSYKQLWRQFLSLELGDVQLSEYRTHQASAFLTELSGRYGRRNVVHVRSTGLAVQAVAGRCDLS
jgi:hypothetical protein